MMVCLTRRYRFSASHRLHAGALSDEENARLFGKCNNPHGHGHNYVLEVTLAGPVDPSTGMVYNLDQLDGVVEREIIERFDRTHLNLDDEVFRAVVPTTENLCREIYRILDEKLEAPKGTRQPFLQHVRLDETSSNSFEYDGERGS